VTLEIPVMHTGLIAEMYALEECLEIKIGMEIRHGPTGSGSLLLSVAEADGELLRGALLAKGYRPK